MLPVHIQQCFEHQALACELLGSPFTSRVCALLGARLAPSSRFGARLAGWSASAKTDVLALRATGALNALARAGACAPLTAVYPPHAADDDALWSGIVAAIAAHDGFLHDYLDSPPQTNEVSRSGSILGGVLHVAAATGLPIDLYEIGSSAGLNLGFDHYDYDFTAARWGNDAQGVRIIQDWQGPLPPLDAPLVIRHRRGCDQNPLDPSLEATRTRLMSYVWPDQAARIARLEAAIASTARSGVRVEKADAADWVEQNFVAPEQGVVKLLFHSIVWGYMPDAVQARIEVAMEKVARLATPAAPVAWLRVEPDGNNPYAAVTLTIHPTGETRVIGHADFHGRFTHWL